MNIVLKNCTIKKAPSMRCFLLLVSVLLLFGKLNAQKINTSLAYSVHTPGKITNKTPVLIFLHGYGSDEADLFELKTEMDPRFIIFSLRAPNSTKSSGYCWYNLDFLPGGEFKYDYKLARKSASKIFSFISNACKVYGVDSTQVFILGFSQGAIMGYELALSTPGKIKGVLALSGRMMKETKELNLDLAKIHKLKFFIAHGISDNVIKVNESEKAEAFLKSKKITGVTFKKYAMQHSIISEELNDIKKWLATVTDANSK